MTNLKSAIFIQVEAIKFLIWKFKDKEVEKEKIDTILKSAPLGPRWIMIDLTSS